MPYRILYYPTYDPSEPWLRGMLLLADTVTRIIPDEVNHADPEYIKDILTAIPNAVTRISPQSADTQLDSINLERLERALQLIPKFYGPQKYILNLHPDGSYSFFDHVFIHESKLSEDVIWLLNRFDLLEDWTWAPGHFVVPQRAADLILGYVADRIGIRTGYDTVTDQNLCFAINSLDGMGVRDEGEIRGALLAMTLRIAIPREIGVLSTGEYLELREKYSQVRKEFRRVLAMLSNDAHLRTIEDPERLRACMIEEISSFNAECEKLRAGRWKDRFQKYVPLAVGTLISAVAGAFEAKEMAIGSAVAGGTISLVQMNVQRDPLSSEQQTQRLLADLRAEILNKAAIASLASGKRR